MASYQVESSCQPTRTENNPYYNDNAPWAEMGVKIGDTTYSASWWNSVPDIPGTLNASTLHLFESMAHPESFSTTTWNEMLKIFAAAVK
jgi:hypothetical protein